jgi:membrane-bound lytic murein transglycosylase D
MMGLTVNRKGDERRDLYKSTTAATKYLELLYSQLNDWLLVIAAYNSGPTPVQKAIELTGSHNFWDIKEYLPKETQGHVLAFIATASIFENMSKFIDLGSIPADFKFGKEDEATLPAPVPAATAPSNAVAPKSTAPIITPKKPVYTDEEIKSMAMIRITEPLNLEVTAAELKVDKKLLARWNPDYDLFVYNKYPTPFYNLRLPKDKLDLFISKKDMLTKKSKAILSQNK